MIIFQSVIDQFIQYAKEQYPNEACGILVSSLDDQQINEFIPIPNQSSNPIHEFEFEPSTIIKAFHRIEVEKKEWIGVIHSHPISKAYPSSIDVHNWFYPELSYWIYSLLDDQLKAYTIIKGEVREIPYSTFN
ncbi:Mov34/MPN/PAD-1 family protein [Tepidibacillus fermentans]|uniref:Proteasome lid subunit RPN8/RPN11 n=1 Tax=Tepidibacillus fermentans TaxID=1281767 RepID=A0A4R3K6F3_9BACI|nr:M67 family metallopeptidase [Tepidibacillus fermentans]TCS78464.1 proteasome lid subunit RPN8/RPN11 [Tepidibacillus fermentans]